MLRVIPLVSSASPVASLLQHLPSSIANVAPERTDELNRILDGYTMEVLDNAQWVCSAAPSEKWIRISTGALEVLWAQAYALFAFYQRTARGKMGDGSVVTIVDPHVRECLLLYEWSISKLNTASPAPWPAGLPRPEVLSGPNSDSQWASEHALVAVGFTLLHEVAHIALRHTVEGGSFWSIDQERDADAFAADWVLPENGLSDAQIVKRTVGVGLSLLCVTAPGFFTGQFGGITHPRDFDRLYNILAHRVPPEREEVWALVVAVLSLLFTETTIPLPTGGWDHFKDAADAMIDVLANRYERGTP